MRIIDLAQRVHLLAPVDTPDSGGGVGREHVLAATVWGAMESGATREDSAIGRRRGRTSLQITIRHRADVRRGWRAAVAGRPFRIVAVRDRDSDRQWLELTVEEET